MDRRGFLYNAPSFAFNGIDFSQIQLWSTPFEDFDLMYRNDDGEDPTLTGDPWRSAEFPAMIVRRATDAYSRRDLDGLLENWAPDAVLDWSNSRGFEAGVYRGHEEIRAFTERFLAAWDEARIEIDSPIEVEEDVLVVENVTYLRGRDGIETRPEAPG